MYHNIINLAVVLSPNPPAPRETRETRETCETRPLRPDTGLGDVTSDTPAVIGRSSGTRGPSKIRLLLRAGIAPHSHPIHFLRNSTSGDPWAVAPGNRI
jgi:hypothetical protein